MNPECEHAYESRLPELDCRGIIAHLLFRVHERALSSFRVRKVEAKVLVAITIQHCVCIAAAELYAAVPEQLVLFGEAERREVVGLRTVLEDDAHVAQDVRRLRVRVGHQMKEARVGRMDRQKALRLHPTDEHLVVQRGV